MENPRPLEERNVAMAQGDEKGGDVREDGVIVDGDGGDASESTLAQVDDLHAFGDGLGHVGAKSLHLQRVGEGAAREDDPAGPMPFEESQIGALPLGAAVGLADDGERAGAAGIVLDP